MIRRLVLALSGLALTAAAPSDDLATLRARLVDLAQQEKAGIARARIAAARLSALNAAEADLKAKIGSNQGSLTRLLSALQSYQRDPPPALLVSPRSARDAVNAAILMRAITPELQRRAKAFADESRRLNALRRDILIADGEFLGAEHDVGDRRAEMDALAEEKARIEERAFPQMAEKAVAAQRLGTLAGSVDELVKGVSVVDPGPASSPDGPPKLLAPVDGAPHRRFGDEFPPHGKSQGWSWTVATGETVLSPAAGRVAYAGPLKGWGFVVILTSPAGYHLVLAGLDRTSAHAGGEVAAGEPVGRIARPAATGPGRSSAASELYMEIRRGAEPVDPARFLPGGHKALR